MSRYFWAVMAFFALVGIFAAPTAFADGPTHDEINDIAEKLNCPTCQGMNVADCPTETCRQWREEIARQLEEGRGEDEILGYFAARYGNDVLQDPPKEGFALLVWMLPMVAVALGAAVLFYKMRVWLSRQVAEVEARGIEEPDDEYIRRVEREIRGGD